MVSQIMNLLQLAPDIQEAVLNLPPTESGRDAVTERDLRPIAAKVGWRVQRRMWKQKWGGSPPRGFSILCLRANFGFGLGFCSRVRYNPREFGDPRIRYLREHIVESFVGLQTFLIRSGRHAAARDSAIDRSRGSV